jgi:biotin carboxylase
VESNPVLLVMGSGDQRFREYLLKSAARRYPIWLFDPDPPSWQQPYITGSTVLDVFDPAAAVAAAAELSRRHPVAGVFCYHEAVIVAAAAAAAALGVPGPPGPAVTTVRDKHRTRQSLAAAGLPQPRHSLVSDLAQAQAAAAELGFPLISKPRGLGASQGVIKVADPDQLAGAIAVSQSAAQRGMRNTPQVLLEQYVTGPEISIDAAITGGACLPFVVARKQVGAEPFFEETGHSVSADDPLLTDPEILDLLAAAHAAVGFDSGITHTEIKLTPHGPVIIEINGRLGGDLIPYLGQLASGIDPARVAIDVALGDAPKLEPQREQTAAIRFLYPPADGRVRQVTMPEPGAVPGLHESRVLAGPGQELRLPPRGYVSRYGYLIARGADAGSCAAVLALAQDKASCAYDPLAARP